MGHIAPIPCPQVQVVPTIVVDDTGHRLAGANTRRQS